MLSNYLQVRHEDARPQESHFSFTPSRLEVSAAKEYNPASSMSSGGSGAGIPGGGGGGGGHQPNQGSGMPSLSATGVVGTGAGGTTAGLLNEFPFGNPVPPSMRMVRIEDLSSVDINWRMLTLARPKTKLEEDIFSRLVQLLHMIED